MQKFFPSMPWCAIALLMLVSVHARAQHNTVGLNYSYANLWRYAQDDNTGIRTNSLQHFNALFGVAYERHNAKGRYISVAYHINPHFSENANYAGSDFYNTRTTRYTGHGVSFGHGRSIRTPRFQFAYGGALRYIFTPQHSVHSEQHRPSHLWITYESMRQDMPVGHAAAALLTAEAWGRLRGNLFAGVALTTGVNYAFQMGQTKIVHNHFDQTNTLQYQLTELNPISNHRVHTTGLSPLVGVKYVFGSGAARATGRE